MAQSLDDVFRMVVDSKQGYRAFKVNRSNDGFAADGVHYGYIITPNNSVLYIQDHSVLTPFKMFHMSFQYVPSREWGSGCEAIDECYEITMDKIKEAEEYGLAYVAKNKIKKWESFEQWYEHYWDARRLEEVL